MPNINLIAERREEKKRLEVMTRRLFMGVVVSTGAVVMLGLYLLGQRLNLMGDLRAAEVELVRLQPTIDHIADIDKDIESLQPKVETLKNARGETMRYRALFQVVSQSLPPSAWLSGFVTSGTPEDTKITLSGMTDSQSRVAEVMDRLQSYPLITKAELTSTSTAPVDEKDKKKVQRVTFEVTAAMRSLTPKKKEGEDGSQTAQAGSGGGKNG